MGYDYIKKGLKGTFEILFDEKELKEIGAKDSDYIISYLYVFEVDGENANAISKTPVKISYSVFN